MTLQGLGFADADPGDILTAKLTLADPTAGSLAGGGGSYNAQTGVWIRSGSATDVNAALGVVTFTPNTGADVSITARVTDAAGLYAEKTFTVAATDGYNNWTPAAVGQTLRAGFQTSSDIDQFQFALTAGSRYAIDLKSTGGASGCADVHMSLVDAQGGFIAYDNNSGGGTDARILFTPTAGGNYGVYALGAGGATGGYTITATLLDDYQDGLWHRIAPYQTVGGGIQSAGDLDMFTISLNAGTTYTIDLKSTGVATGCADVHMSLWNPQGGFVAWDNDSGGGKDARIVFTPTTGGDYGIYAAGLGGATGGYTLLVGEQDEYVDGVWTPAALGQEIGGGIQTPTDLDMFTFNLTAGNAYCIDLKSTGGASGCADLHMSLWDPQGGFVAYDSDSGGGKDACITITPTQSGAYGLYAGGAGGATGRYTLTAKLFDDFADGTWTPVALAQTVNGAIQSAGDLDAFTCTLNAGTTYTIDLKSTGGTSGCADVHMSLWNPQGGFVAWDSDSGGGKDARIVFTPTESGAYGIYAGGLADAIGGYTLFIGEQDEYVDGVWTPVALGQEISGGIQSAGDLDAFTCTLSAGTTYTIDLKSTGGASGCADVHMSLWDPQGGFIAWDNDSGGGKDSRIVVTPTTSGDYRIYAGGMAGATGRYTLKAAVLDDFGDTIQTAAPIPLGATVNGRLHATSDKDVFSFNALAGKSYAFECTCTSPTFGISVSTPGVSTLVSGQTYGSTPAQNGVYVGKGTFTTNQSGPFALQLQSQSGFTGAYTFKVYEYADDVGNSLAFGKPAAVGQQVAGTFEVNGDADHYAYALNAGYSYVFSLKDVTTGAPADYSNQSMIRATNPTTGYDAVDAWSIAQGMRYNQYSLNTSAYCAITPTENRTADINAYRYYTNSSLAANYTIDSVAYLDDASNAFAAPASLPLNTLRAGVLEVAGDIDSFKAIGTVAGTSYQVVIQGLSASNGQITVMPGSTTQAGGMSAGTSMLTDYNTKAVYGTYTEDALVSRQFGVTNVSGTAYTGAYSIEAKPYADDFGWTPSTAETMTLGQLKSGAVEVKGDWDMFKVSLTQGVAYNLSATCDSTGALNVYAPASTGYGTYLNYVNGALEFSSTGKVLHFTAQTTGDYYVGFGALNTQNYQLGLTLAQA